MMSISSCGEDFVVLSGAVTWTACHAAGELTEHTGDFLPITPRRRDTETVNIPNTPNTPKTEFPELQDKASSRFKAGRLCFDARGLPVPNDMLDLALIETESWAIY